METINQIKINLKRGPFFYKLLNENIINQNTNVIVNPANNDLWLGAGVAGAIKKEGGNSIQNECNKIIEKKLRINNGNVVMTGIGNFKNKDLKYIFHAVGPIYRNGMFEENEELYNAFTNSFILADENLIESISLPPISSGIFGFPKDKCAEIFYKSLLDYLNNDDKPNKTLKEVRMVILDLETFNIFINVHNKNLIEFENLQKIKEEKNDNKENSTEVNEVDHKNNVHNGSNNQSFGANDDINSNEIKKDENNKDNNQLENEKDNEIEKTSEIIPNNTDTDESKLDLNNS